MKHFLFLTSTNLAANPRLVKELRLAVDKGFACTVLQFRLGNWSDAITEQLQQEFPSVSFIRLSALRKPFVPWLISSLLENILSKLPYQWHTTFSLSLATGKRSLLLGLALRKISVKYDWVIAHNPATFYSAWKFAARTGAQLGIDVEDYHPGELKNVNSQQLVRQLMRNVLPHASYTSYASALIMQEVKKEVLFRNQEQVVLLNGFYKNEFIAAGNHHSGPLRMIWFSQFVDKGRGLESILQVIEQVKDVQLHLVGTVADAFRDEYIRDKQNVFCHKPMKQQDLHAFLSEFDIGLALEPGRDLNNQLALSNKIMAYAQAGLFILASHTPAQTEFLSNSKLEYVQTELKEEPLRNRIEELVNRKDAIRQTRSSRFANGRTYDWEHTAAQLSNLWGN